LKQTTPVRAKKGSRPAAKRAAGRSRAQDPELPPHVAKALQYARDVVDGAIPACKWVRLACQRHFDDVKRYSARNSKYRFDPDKAERICKFIELLPHTKGRWAVRRPGESVNIVLEPWQCFGLCMVFGWVRRDNGKRRFRDSYEEVPRKNAKSTIAAGVGLYCLAADGEMGAEVYAGATTQKQAWEVFRPAKLMAERTPAFLNAYGVEANASNLHIFGTGSRFEPVIGKPGDGASPSLALVDEYHEHLDDVHVETMRTGMGAREQPLLFVITTAGSDIAGPCYAMRQEVTRMLDGSVPNEELYGIIYTIDEGDDWTSKEALIKANPNFDVSVSGEFLLKEQRDAINSSRKQNAFKTKHLNIWVTAREAWMNMEQWSKCGDATLRPEQFAGEPCYVGLDLSSKLDISSYAKIFRKDVDGVPHFYAFTRNYLPETVVQQPEKQHYQAWMHDGHLIPTDGDIIDYAKIESDILDDDEAIGITELGFDPYGATQLTNTLGEGGITCIEVPQRVQYLSEPMKMIEAYVKSGQFHHDNNPVLNWAMSNVVVKPDANENIFPRKERADNKIDPAVAVTIAMSRAMQGVETTSVYESEGVFFLDD
jgi:phage terminase large subunit-like protein